MNSYEKLLDDAVKENITVIEQYDLSGSRIKGLYCDGTVALSNQIKTHSDKSCVLAEELGHYHTTAGDITDQSSAENRKQELRARLWAYNKKIGLDGIVRAYEQHCQNKYEIADYLDVTEEFLIEALNTYRHKYGASVRHKNYVIFFEPQLAVLKKY